MLRLASTCLGLIAVIQILVPTAALAGDPVAGQKVFTGCKACHQVGETARNTIGPVLNGIVARPAATVEGFAYSEAMRNSGLTWDEANLAQFLKDPKGVLPGNKMVYSGLKDDTRIADLIAYLRQFGPDGKAPQ